MSASPASPLESFLVFLRPLVLSAAKAFRTAKDRTGIAGVQQAAKEATALARLFLDSNPSADTALRVLMKRQADYEQLGGRPVYDAVIREIERRDEEKKPKLTPSRG